MKNTYGINDPLEDALCHFIGEPLVWRAALQTAQVRSPTIFEANVDTVMRMHHLVRLDNVRMDGKIA